MSVYDSVRKDIAAYLAENFDIALDAILPDSTLEDVGFDSLGVLGIAALLENKYGLVLDSAPMARAKTFGELMELVKAKSTELG
jgi:acyl carrier protein